VNQEKQKYINNKNPGQFAKCKHKFKFHSNYESKFKPQQKYPMRVKDQLRFKCKPKLHTLT